jgi:hypothetical protein
MGSHASATHLPVLGHVMRPEFIVHVQLGPDQTTATLYAYRGELAAAAVLQRRHGSSDVIDYQASRPAGVVDVIIDHGNRSRGLPYANGSRHFNWAHYHDYDEKGT